MSCLLERYLSLMGSNTSKTLPLDMCTSRMFGKMGALQYAVDGEIDWAGQINSLANDNYQGHISIETHMRPKVERVPYAAVGRVKELLGKILQ